MLAMNTTISVMLLVWAEYVAEKHDIATQKQSLVRANSEMQPLMLSLGLGLNLRSLV